MPIARLSILILLVILPPVACGDATVTEADYRQLEAVFGGTMVRQEPTYGDPVRSSVYLTMRDGVRIACDVYLPETIAGNSGGERIPAVLHHTRYWRGAELRTPANLFDRPDGYTRFLVPYGYAVIKIDARGSGASFGTRPMPWSPDEIADMREIVAWVVEQSWCNGSVAASGISYVGTTAEFAAHVAHPALKCVVPKFSLFDVYADIAFPGGVRNDWLVRTWGHYNATLDANLVPDEYGRIGRLAIAGVRPVDGHEEALEQAVAEHVANLDLYAAAKQITFRDDRAGPAGLSTDDFSPHAGTIDPDVAIYSWSGWLDGAYADSLLKRFTTLPNPQRAVIGAWNHAGVHDVNPFRPPDQQDADPVPSVLVQRLEEKRYLDFYLKGVGKRPDDVLIYATMGEGGEVAWARTEVWPPKGVVPRVLHLGPGRSLGWDAPAGSGEEVYAVNFSVNSGELNRWRTQLSRSDVVYPDRAAVGAKLLVFDAPPLDAPLEITGSPALTLWLAADAPDTAVFAYLEAVGPDGRLVYLTEGMLRALHRRGSDFLRAAGRELTPGEPARLDITLLSTSVLVPQGWRLRLTLAGADAGQFARVPEAGEVTWQVQWGGKMASRLELPVMPR